MKNISLFRRTREPNELAKLKASQEQLSYKRMDLRNRIYRETSNQDKISSLSLIESIYEYIRSTYHAFFVLELSYHFNQLNQDIAEKISTLKDFTDDSNLLLLCHEIALAAQELPLGDWKKIPGLVRGRAYGWDVLNGMTIDEYVQNKNFQANRMPDDLLVLDQTKKMIYVVNAPSRIYDEIKRGNHNNFAYDKLIQCFPKSYVSRTDDFNLISWFYQATKLPYSVRKSRELILLFNAEGFISLLHVIQDLFFLTKENTVVNLSDDALKVQITLNLEMAEEAIGHLINYVMTGNFFTCSLNDDALKTLIWTEEEKMEFRASLRPI